MDPYNITETWRITADPECYVLEAYRGKNKKRWLPIGYYVTLQQALTGFINISARHEEGSLPGNLHNALGHVRRVLKDLDETLTVTL